MYWPIRLQIFLPFALLLAIAVVGGAVLSSVVSARRAGAIETQRLARVVEALSAADFPYSPVVLQRMRGLSGAEFIAVDADGSSALSTLPAATTLPPLGDVPTLETSSTSLTRFPSITVSGQEYFLSRIESRGPQRPPLYVLYPRETWERLQWDSAWPPLAIGALSLLLMLVVSGWLAHHIGRRVDVVRRLLSDLEAGRYPRLEPPALHDEISALIDSANQLSGRLESLQGEIARTERLRLLAQLAGGFAHQLRNAIAGARLAIQLHARQCPASDDDGLDVALRQLRLTEQQVQALLSLSREPRGTPAGGDLSTVLGEVASLVAPQAEHLQIQLKFDDRLSEPCPVVNRDGLRGALLNLVLNGFDAAGVGGRVAVDAELADDAVRVTIADSGPGPPELLRDRLCEPFVTSKPEGIGLGLVLAQQAAEDQHGTLTWSRQQNETVFLLRWPRTIAGRAGDCALAPLRDAGEAGGAGEASIVTANAVRQR